MCRKKQAKQTEQTENKQEIPQQEEQKMIGFFEIYQYCSPYEKFIAYSGIFASIVAGFASPWSAVVMGEIITIFQPDATEAAV